MNTSFEYGDLDNIDLALQELVRQGRVTVIFDDEGRKMYKLVQN